MIGSGGKKRVILGRKIPWGWTMDTKNCVCRLGGGVGGVEGRGRGGGWVPCKIRSHIHMIPLCENRNHHSSETRNKQTCKKVQGSYVERAALL